MAKRGGGSSLAITGARREGTEDGADIIRLETNAGEIDCRFHPAPGNNAVLYVFGAGGGLGGPAREIYIRLCRLLASEGVAGLRLDYRRPGDLEACVLDVLAGIAFLELDRITRVVLVGHSFGGAVVITAGSLSEAVIAVAALSSQTAGTSAAVQLSPRPLLLIHGGNDRILPDFCSRDIFARAKDPKQLIIYPGCSHGLDECREQLDADLIAWLRTAVAGTSRAGSL